MPALVHSRFQVDEFVNRLQNVRVTRATKQGRSHVFQIQVRLASNLSDVFAKTSAASNIIAMEEGPAVAIERNKVALKRLSHQLREVTENSRCGRCNQINIATRDCKIPVLLVSDSAMKMGVERFLNRMIKLIKKTPDENDFFPEGCQSCEVARAVLTVFVIPEVRASIVQHNKPIRVDRDLDVMTASVQRGELKKDDEHMYCTIM